MEPAAEVDGLMRCAVLLSLRFKKYPGGVPFLHYFSGSQLIRVCQCMQNRIKEKLRPGPRGRIWDIEITGRLTEVPSSFNEPEHLLPTLSLPSHSQSPPSVLDRSSLPEALELLQLEVLSLLPPQPLQAPPKVWGHLGPRCQQLSQSLFGSLGEVEIAGDRALFKGDPTAPCR